MPKEIRVKIEGTCDMLQHKRPPEAEEEETLRRSGEVDYSKDWEKSLYKDDEIGCYVPSKQLRACLVKAAVNFPIKSKGGRKTYKDLVNATVEIEPDKIPLDKDKQDSIHGEWVRIGRNQIWRERPLFAKGWKVNFEIVIFDEQMPVNILKEILDYGGRFVGVGDWRPHFGRFKIVKFSGNNK